MQENSDRQTCFPGRESMEESMETMVLPWFPCISMLSYFIKARKSMESMVSYNLKTKPWKKHGKPW